MRTRKARARLSIGAIAAAVAGLLSTDAVARAAGTEAVASVTRPASTLLDQYSAFIAKDDVFDPSGARLDEPWQILRQDRLNYHVYGVRQHGDESDTFFVSKTNRDRFEQLVAAGGLSRRAASAIVRGDATVRVQIWGRSDVGDYVRVDVEAVPIR